MSSKHELDRISREISDLTSAVKYDAAYELGRIADSLEKLVNMLKPNFEDENET